jgi:methionine sulfoxide reductase heme-binding subunit
MSPAVASIDPRAMWYLTRGTGVVAFLLLTAGVVLGVANVERWTAGNAPRFVIQRVHRDLSLVALVFISVHVATAVIDGFAPIRWVDAVVPFGSVYRPVWLGLGALAVDLVLAIVITSLLRARLGYRVWRAVHWLTYAMWVLVVLHAAGVGSDTRQTWMMATTAASVALVAATVIWRLLRGWDGWEPARAMLAAGVVVVPPALAVWLVFGPLAAGWAERAGTPPSLLAATTHGTSRVTTIVLPDRAVIAGSANLDQGTGEAATLATSAHTTDGVDLSLSVQLDGEQEPQGFLVRSGSVRLVPPDGAAVYRGSVSGVDEGVLRARLSDGFGDVIDLAVQMSISDGRVTGQLAIDAVSSRQVPA